jgi:hypothetical protein
MSLRTRRLLYGLGLVLVWLGFVTEGSYSLFSDTATLASNTLTTGSIDLQVSNSQAGSSTTYSDSRPGFTHPVGPGQESVHYFLLKNQSPSDIPLDLLVMTSLYGESQMVADSVELSFTPVNADGDSIGSEVRTKLGDIVRVPESLGVTVAKGVAQRFRFAVVLSPGYTQQNQSVNYDLVFIGNQHLTVL